jgi:general stress protein 26
MLIDPNVCEAEVISALEQNKKWVLATAAQNRVTARTMSIVNIGLRIFCQTDRNFLKCQQIATNPNVALCLNNIQIEATAAFRGNIFDPANQQFVELYQKFHPSAFERYAHLSNEIVIALEPHLITIWKYIDNQPCRDIYQVREKKAKREFYQTAGIKIQARFQSF